MGEARGPREFGLDEFVRSVGENAEIPEPAKWLPVLGSEWYAPWDLNPEPAD